MKLEPFKSYGAAGDWGLPELYFNGLGLPFLTANMLTHGQSNVTFICKSAFVGICKKIFKSTIY